MNTVDYSITGMIFDIQRFSIHDGPGIRTIVFLKGCPLSCRWCSNPESQSYKPVIMYQQRDCMHCERCSKICKLNAIRPQSMEFINRETCSGCGECAHACPSGALVLKGKHMTVEQILIELKKDATYYRRSGGGITLSGGEPLAQSRFAAELLKACKAQGWHTAVETTACGDETAIRMVMEHADLALTDIKHMDSQIHKQNTRLPNEPIRKGIQLIAKITKTIVRVPVIPGFNSSENEILAIAQFTAALHQVDTIHLLPYHTYGENKYQLLGRKYPMDHQKISEEDMAKLKKVVESQGLSCSIGG